MRENRTKINLRQIYLLHARREHLNKIKLFFEVEAEEILHIQRQRLLA